MNSGRAGAGSARTPRFPEVPEPPPGPWHRRRFVAAGVTPAEAAASTVIAVAGVASWATAPASAAVTLLDAWLVERRRAGRSVLYSRTAAGEVLVTAQRC